MTLLATSFTAVYSLRVVYYVPMGHPRFLALSPINENDPALANPLKRLAWGSIIAGLLITSNISPTKTPVMSMPTELKMAALIVTVLGLVTALELASLTAKQAKAMPQLVPHNFSNMLGYFPNLIHQYLPETGLTLGQGIANQSLDQTWLEKVGPKAVASYNIISASAVSDIQRGVTKTFLTLFLLSLPMILLVTLL